VRGRPRRWASRCAGGCGSARASASAWAAPVDGPLPPVEVGQPHVAEPSLPVPPSRPMPEDTPATAGKPARDEDPRPCTEPVAPGTGVKSEIVAPLGQDVPGPEAPGDATLHPDDSKTGHLPPWRASCCRVGRNVAPRPRFW
jgi:hypothetical protein